MWAVLGVLSSVFLGVYDIFKKISLRDNAVIPVLFFATLTGALIFTPFVLGSLLLPEWASHQVWYIADVDAHAHLLFFAKSVIVASSWLFAYFALKHLPLTIATPIRASGPVWAMVGAILIFGERLTPLQWLGIAVAFVFYYIFSTAGKKEGINFGKNKWVLFMVLATIIGSGSALYDKYLTAHYDRLALQAYFSIYMVAVLLPILLLLWYPNRKKNTPFRWHFAIPLIGITLVAADFVYFYALSIPGSLISVISVLRRGSVLTSFLLGSIVFRSEKNKKLKGLILIGIALGIFIIMLGST
jgi:bacterial/archaeal transporter family protein